MNKELQKMTREWMQLERKTFEQRRIAEQFYDDKQPQRAPPRHPSEAIAVECPQTGQNLRSFHGAAMELNLILWCKDMK